MDKKLILKLIFTCGFVLILSSCTMRASRAPEVKATPTPDISFAMAAEEPQAAPMVANAVGGSSSEHTHEEEAEPTPDTHIPPTYSLQPGEWPMCIARRYNLDPAALLSASGLNFESKPDVGFKLTLPQNTSWPSKFGPRALRAHPVDHTVVAGETLYTISCSFGNIDPSSIVSENNLEPPYKLSGGQVLHIP